MPRYPVREPPRGYRVLPAKNADGQWTYLPMREAATGYDYLRDRYGRIVVYMKRAAAVRYCEREAVAKGQG